MPGSTREARRAGNHAERSPVIVSSDAVARRIRGSHGLISNTSDVLDVEPQGPPSDERL